MPRGVVRTCSNRCGYTAFTFHTGVIPCSSVGCGGFLTWPCYWPHVCPRGHEATIEVDVEAAAIVPVIGCWDCQPPTLPSGYQWDPSTQCFRKGNGNG